MIDIVQAITLARSAADKFCKDETTGPVIPIWAQGPLAFLVGFILLGLLCWWLKVSGRIDASIEALKDPSKDDYYSEQRRRMHGIKIDKGKKDDA